MAKASPVVFFCDNRNHPSQKVVKIPSRINHRLDRPAIRTKERSRCIPQGFPAMTTQSFTFPLPSINQSILPPPPTPPLHRPRLIHKQLDRKSLLTHLLRG